jgi:hypothetical protein
VMSVTPSVCITLAFWLGRGVRTCAKAETAKHNTNRVAMIETELRFRELIVFLLVMGLPGMIHRGNVIFLQAL